MWDREEIRLVTTAEWVVLLCGNDDLTSTVTGPVTAGITVRA
jgi:hypothetical protein